MSMLKLPLSKLVLVKASWFSCLASASADWARGSSGSEGRLITLLQALRSRSAASSLRGHVAGVWIYVAILVGTIAWAVSEAGLDGWALIPRLIAPAVLGFWIWSPWIARHAPCAPAGPLAVGRQHDRIGGGPRARLRPRLSHYG